MLYLIFAILMFGLLILVHELGHFIAAKTLGVRVNEFALGMGPTLWKKQGKETLYALRLFPIGGFCAMEGEDEDTGSDRAFSRQKGWKRLLILAAGAVMNFLAGFLILILLFATSAGFRSTTIVSLMDGCPAEEYLQPGDRIISIDGRRMLLYNDFTMLLARGDDTYYDLVVERNGEKVGLSDVPIYPKEYEVEGETITLYGYTFGVDRNSVGATIRYSIYEAVDFIRMVIFSLQDLVSGAAGLKDMAGPIGIVSTMSEVGENSANLWDALSNLLYFTSFIAINLAVMNLLPLPALDGGRIFFLIVGGLFQTIFRKKLDPKYEGYVHASGMILLLALMAVVAFNDVIRLILG